MRPVEGGPLGMPRGAPEEGVEGLEEGDDDADHADDAVLLASRQGCESTNTRTRLGGDEITPGDGARLACLGTLPLPLLGGQDEEEGDDHEQDGGPVPQLVHL